VVMLGQRTCHPLVHELPERGYQLRAKEGFQVHAVLPLVGGTHRLRRLGWQRVAACKALAGVLRGG